MVGTETAKNKIKEDHIKCPFCDSEALYRYGRAHTGNQRYLCNMCGKQFTAHEKRLKLNDKPVCPVCGRIMHLYKREINQIRFRCSAYPECKAYMVKNIN
jgi:transposase-like protein